MEQKDYLETGFPVWSSLPFLKEYFRGRIKIVFLSRNPLTLINSWANHGAFMKQILPHIKEKILLIPLDEGVSYPKYRDNWEAMDPFEKILYYWTEIKALGILFMNASNTPIIHIKYEELFTEKTIRKICEFLSLEYRQEVRQEFEKKVDSIDTSFNT